MNYIYEITRMSYHPLFICFERRIGNGLIF
nr:MAG TPA: hypothetical protein [Caudoviricetes sp.]